GAGHRTINKVADARPFGGVHQVHALPDFAFGPIFGVRQHAEDAIHAVHGAHEGRHVLEVAAHDFRAVPYDRVGRGAVRMAGQGADWIPLLAENAESRTSLLAGRARHQHQLVTLFLVGHLTSRAAL